MVYLKNWRGMRQENNNKNNKLNILLRAGLYAGALSFSVTMACAQQPAQAPAETSGPTFDIKRFELSGNTLLSTERIQALIAPYVGTQRTLADVQRAQAVIEEAYRSLGYGIVQVTLPEQDITSGVIRYRVLQPKVGKVVLDGNLKFDSNNVRASLPTIREGQIPNSTAIARNLQITGEHPVKKTTVLLRTSDDPEIIDVNIKIDDDKPWRFVFTLDNTGSSDTGYLRSGLGFQHTNLFNRDHSGSFQYVTSPTNPNKVTIFGAGYHVPLYGLNSSVDVVAGYSNVNSGMVQGLFNVAGSGLIFGAKWNYYLPKFASVDHKISLGVDYRAFHNNVTLAGVGLVPDITIRPVTLGYSGNYRDSSSDIAFNLSVSANVPGGNDGGSADFSRSRANATDRYVIYRAAASYQTTFAKDWQARAAVTGQYTRDALVAGELYGLGGSENLRGFLVREVNNDRGVSGQLELYTPELARLVGLPDKFRMRMLGFYEYGHVWRNKALPGEITSTSIADAGLGVRFNYGKALSLRVDVANILTPSGTRQRGDNRVSAGMALVF
jgi:hemolysin activation/secretion protein